MPIPPAGRLCMFQCCNRAAIGSADTRRMPNLADAFRIFADTLTDQMIAAALGLVAAFAFAAALGAVSILQARAMAPRS